MLISLEDFLLILVLLNKLFGFVNIKEDFSLSFILSKSFVQILLNVWLLWFLIGGRLELLSVNLLVLADFLS